MVMASILRPFSECVKSCLKSSESEAPPVPEFGQEMRDEEFVLKEGISFLNHGSFGVVPRRIKDAQNR